MASRSPGLSWTALLPLKASRAANHRMSSRHHFECRLFGKVDAGTKKLSILGWRFLGNIKDHGCIQLLFMEYFFVISGFLGKGYQNDDQLKVAI